MPFWIQTPRLCRISARWPPTTSNCILKPTHMPLLRPPAWNFNGQAVLSACTWYRPFGSKPPTRARFLHASLLPQPAYQNQLIYFLYAPPPPILTARQYRAGAHGICLFGLKPPRLRPISVHCPDPCPHCITYPTDSTLMHAPCLFIYTHASSNNIFCFC